MLPALIIEDEKPSARRLKRMLEKEQLQVVAMLSGVEEAIEWFQQHEHPELIFLDIQLSDGLSFEIFEQVEIRSAIIFTTAYDEYALRAFKLNSVDYLMKPIDDEELQAALVKYRSNRTLQQQGLDLSQLKALLNLNSSAYKKRFTVQVGQHLKLINAAEISCFYSENKGTYLHSTANRSYSLDTSLDKLEPELEPKVFFRVNRQFIVNLNNIADIITYSNQRLEVRLRDYSATQIVISRERVKTFKEWLE